MSNQSTVDKLMAMKLTRMAEAYIAQNDDAHLCAATFDERLSIIVDEEYIRRVNNRHTRLLKKAHLEQPHAYLANIDYTQGRTLNRNLIDKLSTCEYIDQSLNVFITGPSGAGKTCFACGLGNAACDHDFSTYFMRLPDFITDIELAKQEGPYQYKKAFSKYVNPKLLIIDEWLLVSPNEEKCGFIRELIHKRRRKSSTIFCSQYADNEWYNQLGGDDNPLAEAILDRIIHDAYRIDIRSMTPGKDVSMREVYGLHDD